MYSLILLIFLLFRVQNHMFKINGLLLVMVITIGLPLVMAACPAGQQVVNVSSCEACLSNTFNPGDADFCQNCTLCHSCDPTNGFCLTCYAGMELSSNSCSTCATDTYAPVDGSTLCSACPGCSVCDSITGACSACQPGYELSITSCVICPSNTYSLGGNSSCVTCSSC